MVRLKKGWIPRDEFFKKWKRLREMLYDTRDYNLFLTEVRTRAGHRCERCPRPGREVHHKIRVYDDPSLACDVDNGEFLCGPCHKKHHKKEEKE